MTRLARFHRLYFEQICQFLLTVSLTNQSQQYWERENQQRDFVPQKVGFVLVRGRVFALELAAVVSAVQLVMVFAVALAVKTAAVGVEELSWLELWGVSLMVGELV
jgi:hypothetical protein